ncbi:hypothetical protein KC315_g8626 [Hortaea werneckii]|nr:hypothetical protein KC315_g8626 [Hortaea werneckii]
MAFQADTILQLVCLITWTVVSGTPLEKKHEAFAQVLPSLLVLEAVASSASFFFAPGLYEVLQSASSPTLAFFKGLPSDLSWSNAQLRDRWVVYAIVLEKPDRRPRVYIGTATQKDYGSRSRMQHYDNAYLLPRWVAHALKEGFEITHKGFICWIPRPTADMVPVRRLLFKALEASFTFYFWAMKSRYFDWGMEDISPWDRHNLEYDGLCSHSSLYEDVLADFDLTPEQLIAQAADREAKRLKLKAENATNHHFKQMETNYDEYIGEAIGRKMKSRALNPHLDQIAERTREDRIRDEKRFYCALCDEAFTRQSILDTHLASPKHERMKEYDTAKYKCTTCKKPLSSQQKLNEHNKGVKHRAMVANNGVRPKYECTPCKVVYVDRGRYEKHLQDERHKAVMDAVQSSEALD